MKMHRPENDISLSDGLAYMVANKPYQKHVAQAANNEEVYYWTFINITYMFIHLLHLLEVNMPKP